MSHAVTGSQIKAGRTLLKMRAENLADAAGISLKTMRKIEAATDGAPTVGQPYIAAVVLALNTKGVTFGPGLSVSVRQGAM